MTEMLPDRLGFLSENNQLENPRSVDSKVFAANIQAVAPMLFPVTAVAANKQNRHIELATWEAKTID